MSEPETEAVEPQKSGRVGAIDCARGLALVGMAGYHLTWDLADFLLVPPMLPFTPAMRIVSHVVASAFLGLVGVSLALAHRDRLNLMAFWRRLAVVVGAAALVTAGSLVFAPGMGIWFGILHCIAAASLVALPLVMAPAWASLIAGAVAIALPFWVHSPLFDSPALLWLGLGVALPDTLDWRPFLPWAGVVLLGLGTARLPGVLDRLTSPRRWRAKSQPARAICLAGRHSLAVYLLHQPILIALVAAVAHTGLVAVMPPPEPDFGAFLAACERACTAHGQSPNDCATSCQCVADVISRSGEADRLGALDAKSRADLKHMADACMGREPAGTGAR